MCPRIKSSSLRVSIWGTYLPAYQAVSTFGLLTAWENPRRLINHSRFSWKILSKLKIHNFRFGYFLVKGNSQTKKYYLQVGFQKINNFMCSNLKFKQTNNCWTSFKSEQELLSKSVKKIKVFKKNWWWLSKKESDFKCHVINVLKRKKLQWQSVNYSESYLFNKKIKFF